jgi:hypothetical protein
MWHKNMIILILHVESASGLRTHIRMRFLQPFARPLGNLNLCLKAGVDPCFVALEAYTIFGALFKKNNIKLHIQN